MKGNYCRISPRGTMLFAFASKAHAVALLLERRGKRNHEEGLGEKRGKEFGRENNWPKWGKKLPIMAKRYSLEKD